MKKIIAFLLAIIFYVALAIFILVSTGNIKIQFITNKTEEKSIDSYINNGLTLDNKDLNLSQGKADRYYYNQLDNTSKIIYDKIIAEKEKLKTGTEHIKFTNKEFDEILNKSTGMGTLSTAYQNAVDAIRLDQVDLFYVDFSKTVLRTITYTRGNNKSYEVYLDKSTNEKNYLQDNIKSKSDIDEMIIEINAIKEALLPQITGSNYEKILYIHNWLIDNLEYDTTQNENNTRNIYGALLEQKVVCEGYAKTFKYILDELEIPCILISGDAKNSQGITEKHMWNYVQINDKWYAVDVTWDDPIIINENNGNVSLPNDVRYKYFCQGTKFNENHFADKIITKSCQEWKYPELYNK